MKKTLIYILTMFFCILMIPMIIVSFGNDIPYMFEAEKKDTQEPSGTPQLSDDRPNPSSTGISVTPGVNGEYTIKVYDHKKKEVFEISLEEYIQGVVLAEMPGYFEMEALKAQSVAARTFTYKKMISANKEKEHEGADICTDSNHCQAYRAPDQVADSTPDANGNNAMTAEEKIKRVKKAVEDTAGIIAVYKGEPIEALYHSCSGGMTENIENVWSGSPVPYLKAVISKGEEAAGTKYKNRETISKSEFISKLKSGYEEFDLDGKDLFDCISEIKRSDSGRILSMKIGNISLSGKELRALLGLNSANISFSEENQNIIIITYGFGHGVGMSQYGAEARAKDGMKFEAILKYYYKGIDLIKIN